MATRAQWITGARPQTLPVLLTSVVVGTAIAVAHGHEFWLRAVLTLFISLGMQLGANFANDYSDGIRGTDENRVGPLRLVGSGVASPRTVKTAAFACFGIGALFGLAVAALSHQWWVIVPGVIIILAGWYYTGGKHPYGYMGLGDPMVFIFFGPVAVGLTVMTQGGRFDWTTLVASCIGGAGGAIILMVNNIRDIDTDRASGKRTLAAKLGDGPARKVFVAYCAITPVATIGVAALTTWWALLGLVCLIWLIPCARFVGGGGTGPGLVHVIKRVSIAQITCALAMLVGVLISRL